MIFGMFVVKLKMTIKYHFRYINFLAEMVDNDNNPSDGKKQAIQPEKKVVVYSARGKYIIEVIR